MYGILNRYSFTGRIYKKIGEKVKGKENTGHSLFSFYSHHKKLRSCMRRKTKNAL